MISIALLLLLGGGLSVAAPSSDVWLIIGASDTSAAGIASKAKALSTESRHGLIVQTRDCGDAKNVFGWAAEIAPSAPAAAQALTRVRATVKDAYVKRCTVRSGSMLAVNFPAVDSSISNVPTSAVNWSDEDRVSSAVPLADGRVLVVARYFVNEPSDPLEGRRERVLLLTGQDRQTRLIDDCPSAAAMTMRQSRVALQCATEQAGEQLLHSVLVFDANGTRLIQIAHCRNPRWVDDQALRCEEESVASNGDLRLHAKRVAVPGAVEPNRK